MVNLDCLLNCVLVLDWALAVLNPVSDLVLPNLVLEPVLDLVVVVANLVLRIMGSDLVVLVPEVGPVVDFDYSS